MAKVEHRTARKDYPSDGIKKGDKYYFAKIKTGPYSSRTIRQITPIMPWQLTSSDFLSTLWQWEHAKSNITSMGDAQELAEEIRALGDECDEKFENMPEGLQQGEIGVQLEERRDACHQAADEIDEIFYEWEGRDEDEGEEEDEQDFIDRVMDVEVNI